MPSYFGSQGKVPIIPAYMPHSVAPGIGGQPIWDSRYANIAAPSGTATSNLDRLPLPLGTIFDFGGGRKAMYVRAKEALSEGHLVSYGAAVGYDVVVSQNDDWEIYYATGGWTPGDYAGDFVYVDDSSDTNEEGQMRRIVGNTADTLTLDRALDETLDAADADITILRPFQVSKASTNDAECVVGVALHDFTDEYYGWVQISGVAQAICESTVNAALLPLTASGSTAGYANVVGAATLDEALIIGQSLAAAPADGALTPILLFPRMG